MRKTVVVVTAAAAILSLAACGKKDAGTVNEPVSAEAEKVTAAGSYKLYAVESEGYTLRSSEMFEDDKGTLELKENGTGMMTFNGETDEINSWKLNGDTVEISFKDEETLYTGECKDGILKIDVAGVIMYFVTDNADTSSIKTMTLDEMFEDVMKNSDTAAGNETQIISDDVATASEASEISGEAEGVPAVSGEVPAEDTEIEAGDTTAAEDKSASSEVPVTESGVAEAAGTEAAGTEAAGTEAAGTEAAVTEAAETEAAEVEAAGAEAGEIKAAETEKAG